MQHEQRGVPAVSGRLSAGARVASLVLALASLAPVTAEAHLLPSGRATLNRVGTSVFAVVSVPVSALSGYDDDGDGLLSLEELGRHEDGLRDQIRRRFDLHDGDVHPEVIRLDLALSPEHEARPDRADQVVALEHVAFSAPPRSVGLRTDLFDPRSTDPRLTVTASRARDPATSESAELTPTVSSHEFLVSSSVSPARWPAGTAAGVWAGLVGGAVALVLGRALRRRLSSLRPGALRKAWR
jgi:hypothetical protein